MKRKVFFSFHYNRDNWRAAQVRNMGKVSGDSTFSDNEWEALKEESDEKISSWIDAQLLNTSCVVVLIGVETANRKWINYEIKRAIELNKGIIGIYVNKLKNYEGVQDTEGKNPFDNFTVNGRKASEYIKCFKSSFSSSKYVYKDISDNIQELIEYGLKNKPSTW